VLGPQSEPVGRFDRGTGENRRREEKSAPHGVRQRITLHRIAGGLRVEAVRQELGGDRPE